MITIDQILEHQEHWRKAILDISEKFSNHDESLIETTKRHITNLYNYEHGQVMFKPTKVSTKPFRSSLDGALSYFLGYNVVEDSQFEEDCGFAINNGSGWKNIKFINHQFELQNDFAFCNGIYEFTCERTLQTVSVEYTIGYKLINNTLKIFLHHLSIPFNNI